MDHLVVAYTESQVQNILSALADESVLSSINAMRSLVAEAMRSSFPSGGSTKSKFPRRHCASESSCDETAMSGYSTTGYTSGALCSEYDCITAQARQQSLGVSKDIVASSNPAGLDIPAVLCLGYCAADYQPLA